MPRAKLNPRQQQQLDKYLAKLPFDAKICSIANTKSGYREVMIEWTQQLPSFPTIDALDGGFGGSLEFETRLDITPSGEIRRVLHQLNAIAYPRCELGWRSPRRDCQMALPFPQLLELPKLPQNRVNRSLYPSWTSFRSHRTACRRPEKPIQYKLPLTDIGMELLSIRLRHTEEVESEQALLAGTISFYSSLMKSIVSFPRALNELLVERQATQEEREQAHALYSVASPRAAITYTLELETLRNYELTHNCPK